MTLHKPQYQSCKAIKSSLWSYCRIPFCCLHLYNLPAMYVLISFLYGGVSVETYLSDHSLSRRGHNSSVFLGRQGRIDAPCRRRRRIGCPSRRVGRPSGRVGRCSPGIGSHTNGILKKCAKSFNWILNKMDKIEQNCKLVDRKMATIVIDLNDYLSYYRY